MSSNLSLFAFIILIDCNKFYINGGVTQYLMISISISNSNSNLLSLSLQNKIIQKYIHILYVF